MTDHPQITALIVPFTGTPEIRRIDTGLRPMQELVSGMIEPISGEEWTAWFDEEGKIKQRPVNEPATRLVTWLGWTGTQHGDFLVGDVVFVGNGPDGDDADVPAAVLDAAREIGALQ